jgi:hypothetical protein
MLFMKVHPEPLMVILVLLWVLHAVPRVLFYLCQMEAEFVVGTMSRGAVCFAEMPSSSIHPLR